MGWEEGWGGAQIVRCCWGALQSERENRMCGGFLRGIGVHSYRSDAARLFPFSRCRSTFLRMKRNELNRAWRWG